MLNSVYARARGAKALALMEMNGMPFTAKFVATRFFLLLLSFFFCARGVKKLRAARFAGNKKEKKEEKRGTL